MQKLNLVSKICDADDLVGEVQVLQHNPRPRVHPSVFGGALEVVNCVRLQTAPCKTIVHDYEQKPLAVQAQLERSEHAAEQ
eukprot:4852580-Alexandrium_andersonii.AAC.1